MGLQEWWRTAVVYEVYLRSFADSDGDGVGDIGGLRGKLPYLADLGVDAVWVTPWYPSPMADGGYDVSDYCDIDPRFGTLADADDLLADAHARGLRVIIDLVANHTSDQHPWFRAALAAEPGAPERRRYFFRDGRDDGEAPPNDWISAFGGPAWTRVREADGRPGQWYLHTFAPEQPDLDWEHPGVREDFDDVLRFWLDRGVDGLRVDAAPAMAKAPGLRTPGTRRMLQFPRDWVDNPHWDVDGVHDVLRRWRAIGNAYGATACSSPRPSSGPRAAEPLRAARRDAHELQLRLPDRPLGRPRLRAVVDETRRARAGRRAGHLGALQSRRDPTRDRFGRRTPARASGEPPCPPDRRTRSSASGGPGRPCSSPWRCPGSAYLYQGEARAARGRRPARGGAAGPDVKRSGYAERGRDGCRVPLPWSGDRPPFGFTTDGVEPWLPSPRVGRLSRSPRSGPTPPPRCRLPDRTPSAARAALPARRPVVLAAHHRRRRAGIRPRAYLPVCGEPVVATGGRRLRGAGAGRQRSVVRRTRPGRCRLAGADEVTPTPSGELLESGNTQARRERWAALSPATRRLVVVLGVLCVAAAGLVWFRDWSAERELRNRVALTTALSISSSSTTPPGGQVGYYVVVRNEGRRRVSVTAVEGTTDRLRLRMRDDAARPVDPGTETAIPLSVLLSCAPGAGRSGSPWRSACAGRTAVR